MSSGRKKKNRYPNDIPPGGEPVSIPNDNDVLSGRGGRINSHHGNVQFRELVKKHQVEYLAKTTKKLDKAKIADKIIQQIRSMNPPGRFLREDSASGAWIEIGDARARKKTGQAMREGAPNIREGLEAAEDDDSDSHNMEDSLQKDIEPNITTPSDIFNVTEAKQASMPLSLVPESHNDATRNNQPTMMNPNINNNSENYTQPYSDSHVPLQNTQIPVGSVMNNGPHIPHGQPQFYPPQQNCNPPQQLGHLNPFGMNMNSYPPYAASQHPLAGNFNPGYQKPNNLMGQQPYQLPESINLEPNPVFTNQWAPQPQSQSPGVQDYFSICGRSQNDSDAYSSTQLRKEVAFNQQFTPLPEHMRSTAVASNFSLMSINSAATPTLTDSSSTDLSKRANSPVNLTRTGSNNVTQWPNQPNQTNQTNQTNQPNSPDTLENSESNIRSYLPNQLRSSDLNNQNNRISIRNSIRSVDNRRGTFQLRRSLSLTDIEIDFSNSSFVFQSTSINNDAVLKALEVSDTTIELQPTEKQVQSKTDEKMQRNSSSSGSGSCIRSGSSKSKTSSPHSNHSVGWDRQTFDRPMLGRRRAPSQQSNMSMGSIRSSGSSWMGSMRASMEYSGSSSRLVHYNLLSLSFFFIFLHFAYM